MSSPLVAALLSCIGVPCALGAVTTLIAGRSNACATPGLLFHSIGTQHPLTMSAMPPKLFTAIVQKLFNSGYHSVCLSEAHSSITDTGIKEVLITFDDGCRSFYTHALPLFHECGYRVTLFPVAKYFGKKSTWDVLPPFEHLSVEELRVISASNHEIGSHTMTHADCTFLSTTDLATELRDSKQVLEDIISRPVTALSFPFGSWNRRVWETAGEIGYTRATIYRGHRYASPSLFPVYGVYRFDTPQTVLTRIRSRNRSSLSVALASCMSHFARGAPLWKFKKEYSVLRKAG
jgi:peptidoglycan/xylan/chitin deacetylase (PgdA/CDA1 family)